jgi:hypothetical protein
MENNDNIELTDEEISKGINQTTQMKINGTT